MTEPSDSKGKCPFSGANTSMSDRSNKDWWPNQLNLKILHQNPPSADPMGEEFDYAEIPDDRLVMTTWHSEETIAEVFWFCKNCAFHPTVDISNDMILHLSPEPSSRKLTDGYFAA